MGKRLIRQLGQIPNVRFDLWLHRHRKAAVLFITAATYFWFVPYFDNTPHSKFDLNNPNEIMRAYSVKAVVEFGHVYLNDVMKRWHTTRTDMAGRKRRAGDPDSAPAFLYFSPKPPGMTIWVIPFYTVYFNGKRLLGGDAVSRRELVIFCRVFGCIMPMIAFGFVFFLCLSRISNNGYLVGGCYLIYLLGTTTLPYTLIFVNHSFSAGAIFCAFAILYQRDGRPGAMAHWRYGLAGLLLGFAVAAEYPLAIAGLFLGLYALWCGTDRSGRTGIWGVLFDRRHLPVALLGVALPISLVLAYHDFAYGHPFKSFGEYMLNPAFRKVWATGIHGFSSPTWEAFVGSFFAPNNGLFFYSPFLALFPLGVVAAVATGRFRVEVVLGVAVVAAYALFISCMVVWKGGWTVGPRYITVVVPPMVALTLFGLDWLWRRNPSLSRVLLLSTGLVSISVVLPSALLFPHLPEALVNPYYEAVVPLLSIGLLPQTLLGVSGGWAVTLPTLTVVLAAWFLAVYGTAKPGGRWRSWIVALTLCAIFHVGFSQLYPVDSAKRAEFVEFAKKLAKDKPLWN